MSFDSFEVLNYNRIKAQCMEKFRSVRSIRRYPATFSAGNKDYSGISSDFSYTGLFIRTRNPLAAGTPLKILIQVRDDMKIELTGVVIRATKTRITGEKNGMGIKIDHVTEEYKTLLTELLRTKT